MLFIACLLLSIIWMVSRVLGLLRVTDIYGVTKPFADSAGTALTARQEPFCRRRSSQFVDEFRAAGSAGHDRPKPWFFRPASALARNGRWTGNPCPSAQPRNADIDQGTTGFGKGSCD